MPDNLQVRIRKFIESIGELKETLHDSNLDFGFRFLYPHKKGRTITIVKPKKKNKLELQSPTTISPEHLEKLDDEKQNELFIILGKIFLRREIHHGFDLKEKRYFLLSNYFYEDESEITIDKLHNYIKHIYFMDLYAVGVIQQFVSGTFKTMDFDEKLTIYS